MYVPHGKLRLRLGEQDLTSSRGETAEFDTRTPNAMSATGARPVQVTSIFNEAGAWMHIHVTDRTAETPGANLVRDVCLHPHRAVRGMLLADSA